MNLSGNTQYGVANGQVSMHPGWDNSFSVTRWTSPVTGQVSVSGYFGAGDSGAMSYYIYENGVLVQQWLNNANTQNFAFTTTVASGETIDFLVGVNTNAGYACGNTPIEAIITTVPIPGEILLLGPGLIGLAAMRRRFKK